MLDLPVHILRVVEHHRNNVPGIDIHILNLLVEQLLGLTARNHELLKGGLDRAEVLLDQDLLLGELLLVLEQVAVCIILKEVWIHPLAHP